MRMFWDCYHLEIAQLTWQINVTIRSKRTQLILKDLIVVSVISELYASE